MPAFVGARLPFLEAPTAFNEGRPIPGGRSKVQETDCNSDKQNQKAVKQNSENTDAALPCRGGLGMVGRLGWSGCYVRDAGDGGGGQDGRNIHVNTYLHILSAHVYVRIFVYKSTNVSITVCMCLWLRTQLLVSLSHGRLLWLKFCQFSIKGPPRGMRNAAIRSKPMRGTVLLPLCTFPLGARFGGTLVGKSPASLRRSKLSRAIPVQRRFLWLAESQFRGAAAPLRSMPKLCFIADQATPHGQALLKLIDELPELRG